MKRFIGKILSLMLCLALLLSLSCMAVSAEAIDNAVQAEALNSTEDDLETTAEPEVDDSEDADDPVEDTQVESDNLLDLENHSSYISGYTTGLFKPSANLTRAEAAVIMYGLLKDQTQGTSGRFTDVADSAWYAASVNALASLGILNGDTDGRYRPGDSITRAEFVTIICHFFDMQTGEVSFTDVTGHWALEFIISADAQGWISGYGDNTFKPNSQITRAETVSLVNNMMGRWGDEAVIRKELYYLFPDVLPSAWYYSAVMEATVEHTAEVTGDTEVWTTYSAPQSLLESGYYVIDGYTYYVTPERLFAHDTTVETLQFGSDCRYTSGDVTLDGYLHNIVLSQTSSSDNRESMRLKLYTYSRDNFTYLGQPALDKDATGWETEKALYMITNGRGNCYNFAAIFYHLTRYIGYPCNTVLGTFAGGTHAWVEMVIDGTTYVCDPQLDYRYRNNGNYSYNFYMVTYDMLPSGYAW